MSALTAPVLMKKLSFLLYIFLSAVGSVYSQPFNQAVYFDGVSRADFPAALLSNTSVFTIEFWIRTTDLRSSGTYYNRAHIFGNVSPASASRDFAINMSNGYIGMWNGLGASDASMLSGKFISDNQWHHIAAVNNGTTITLYVDGTSVGSLTSGGALVTTSPAHFQLSGHTNFAGTVKAMFFIDELRISNNVRYNAAFTPPTAAFSTGANTVGLYHMDGCSANLIDATANAYNATFTGTCVNTTTARAPGSGTAINFTGTSTLTIDNIAYDDFTMEMWYNTTNTGSTGGGAYSGNRLIDGDVVGTAADMVPMSLFGSKLAFGTGEGGAPSAYETIFSTTNINDGKWHHLAVTRVAATGEKRLYVDGRLEATGMAATGSLNGPTNLTVGAGDGKIDEIRIWNTVLTQTEIRDYMCKKIRGTHPKFNNMVTYLNFDDGTTTIVADTKSNNHGVLSPAIARSTSGAPIGDEQVSSFAGAASSANITASRGDGITASLTSGAAAGIVVYRVDEFPNVMTGATQLGDNNIYYGVFVVGGTNPAYSLVYDYTGLSFTTASENGMQLFRRADNSITSWTNTNAALNMPANTMTTSGTQSEYVAGNMVYVLPVALLNFQVQRKGTTNAVNWKTAYEYNVDFFAVEKSSNGATFHELYKLAANQNTRETRSYFYDDHNARHLAYYRLKTIDKNGHAAYSKVVKVDAGEPGLQAEASPNPAQSFINIKGLKGISWLKLNSSDGRVLQEERTSENEYRLNLQKCSPGVYWLQITNENGMQQVLKIIRQ